MPFSVLASNQWVPFMIETKISLSTITPVYSGALYLEKLVYELAVLRDQWLNQNAPIMLTEAIFIDDAAIDESSKILDELALKYSWVTTIHLSRNFGQHPATIAGILHSSGDWIVTLDEDFQHPPEQIETLLRKAAKEGCDIVYAYPQEAVHQSIVRDFTSRFYKKIMAKLTGNKNIPFFNSFRLIRGSIARAASSVCSHETYFDIALSWFTQRVGRVGMTLKDERTIRGDKSGYTFLKLLSHARRMIISTHAKAMRIGSVVGLLGLITSFAYGGYIFIQRLIVPNAFEVRGWGSLMVTILFLGGVTVSLIGVLLEYMVVILLHTQGKPTFFVADRRSDIILKHYFKDRTE